MSGALWLIALVPLPSRPAGSGGGCDLSGCSAVAEWRPIPGLFAQGGYNDLLGHLGWSWVIILSVRVKVGICKHPEATGHVMMVGVFTPLPALSSGCSVKLLETESKCVEMKKCLTGQTPSWVIGRRGKEAEGRACAEQPPVLS